LAEVGIAEKTEELLFLVYVAEVVETSDPFIAVVSVELYNWA
jgi:hypothetical protein